MSKSKTRKQEVGKSRPTENRASRAMVNEQVSVWLEKINGTRFLPDASTQTNAVAEILIDLIGQIKSGKVDREVITKVVEIANCKLSLYAANHKLIARERRQV